MMQCLPDVEALTLPVGSPKYCLLVGYCIRAEEGSPAA